MTGYARHRSLSDFAQEVEIGDRMLVISVAAISERQVHISGMVTQNKIRQMKMAFCFHLLASMPLKLV